MIVVHTIIPNQTKWLFSNLAIFRAKIRLLSSANGERSLYRPVPLSARQLQMTAVDAR